MIGNTDPNSARSESIRSKETVAINSDEFPLDSLLPEWFVAGEGCRTDVRGTFVIVSAVCAKVCQRSQLPGCPPPAGRHPWFALPGFFHREGNAPSQWGQQAYLRPSRLSRSAPALASASFRLPRRSSLPVGRQQPWFAWVKLGSVGPPLSSPSHGGPCEGAGNLGLCLRRDSDSFQIDATNLFSLLGVVIENHTTNTSDPERLDGRWGERVL